jgi:hypothetical protein
MVKMDALKFVSRNVAVHKTVSTTVDDELLYCLHFKRCLKYPKEQSAPPCAVRLSLFYIYRRKQSL